MAKGRLGTDASRVTAKMLSDAYKKVPNCDYERCPCFCEPRYICRPPPFVFPLSHIYIYSLVQKIKAIKCKIT